jgi:hypothetical protein
MATVTADGPDLVVRLSWKEKMGALHGNMRVPVSSVQTATVELTPWNAIRGKKFADPENTVAAVCAAAGI